MTSHTTKQFRRLYRDLPEEVREAADRAYKLWRSDHYHKSLQFKQVHATQPIFSVRIGLDWRALGVVSGTTIIWYWIGSHAEYDALLARM